MQENPFEKMRLTPANHFRLYFYSAVSELVYRLAREYGDTATALESFPFLAGYCQELIEHGFSPEKVGDGTREWAAMLAAREAEADWHLPIRALAEAAELDFVGLRMLFSIALVEEDIRFGAVFEHRQGVSGQPRPTIGSLQAGLGAYDSGGSGSVSPIGRLLDLGLARVVNLDSPRSNHALQVPALLWAAIRGETLSSWRWLRHLRHSELLSLDQLFLPEETTNRIRPLPALLAAGEVRSLIVRGPEHSGRRTLTGVVAKSLGLDLLEVHGVGKGEEERLRLIGPLATLLHAMPLIFLDSSLGEAVDLPWPESYRGPLAVVMLKAGSLTGAVVERSASVSLGAPDIDTRRRHWAAALGPAGRDSDLESISESFRMVSGNIRRAAQLAKAYAAVEHNVRVTANDVLQAKRVLTQQTLDALAKPVTALPDWDRLAVAGHTLEELRNLESRCRHRERLQAIAVADLNPGVRVLFHGQSGTGKTLGARVLAGRLEKDLYRMDLSTVVNKYIGETEKNLERVLSRAEELDVILLLDEGDALLTQRTSIHNANDRYANLETNYLLQRLESFEGILIVTTNAVERIDSAFHRRMDVVVDFRPPDAAERWSIWQLHLPAAHDVDPLALTELATRCTMTGGQIRNAALHAAVLALDRHETVSFSHIEPAVQREYRKMGGICPLRMKIPPPTVWQ
jgi:ATPase family associated with various cellular activities (AAA)